MVLSGLTSLFADEENNNEEQRFEFASDDQEHSDELLRQLLNGDFDEEGKEHNYEDWNIPADVVVPDDAVISTHDGNGKRFTHRAINPAYDPDREYVPREERQEWDAVGLMGKLRIRKGQVTGARWIKMRDVSDTVEEWLVR